MKKLFLDSDVILDSLLKRPEFYLPATNIFALGYQKKIKLMTSAVAFVNVHYFLDKFDRANKFSLLKRTRSIMSIITVDEKIVDMALESTFDDTEDAIQHLAAINAKADFIITRNIKGYKSSTIPVLTAEQFLRTIL